MDQDLCILSDNIKCVIPDNSFETELEYFLSVLRSKGRKEATIRTYREALLSVRRKLAELGMDCSVSDLTPSDIVMLKDCLGVCETSAKLYLTVVGRMQECLGKPNSLKRADILWNQCDHRRLFITLEEFRTMLIGCTPLERIIMVLGAFMGLRRSEIIGIRMKDVHAGYVLVHGKGHGANGKTVRVPIPSTARKELRSWMRHRSEGEYLVNVSGRRLTTSQLGHMIERISARNKVEFTPHSLRRLFATTLYDAGVDLNTIRVLMRHNSINTTLACYIDVNPQRKKDALDRLCKAFDSDN